MANRPQRLEIFDLTLGASSFADDWGDRPCVIVSHDFYNERLNTVVVVTLTLQDRSRDTGCVKVKRTAVSGGPGLVGDSFAVCHSPLTVPQGVLTLKRGRLSDPATTLAIENAIAFSLNLGPDDGF